MLHQHTPEKTMNDKETTDMKNGKNKVLGITKSFLER